MLSKAKPLTLLLQDGTLAARGMLCLAQHDRLVNYLAAGPPATGPAGAATAAPGALI